MENTIYMPEVIAYADRVMSLLEEGLHPKTKLNFFQSEFSTPDRGRNLFRTIISDVATANFLEREDNEVKLSMEQMADSMKEAVIRASLEELRDKGLVDWVEDEKGDEIVFLTEQGKAVGKSLFESNGEESSLEDEALKSFYEKE